MKIGLCAMSRPDRVEQFNESSLFEKNTLLPFVLLHKVDLCHHIKALDLLFRHSSLSQPRLDSCHPPSNYLPVPLQQQPHTLFIVSQPSFNTSKDVRPFLQHYPTSIHTPRLKQTSPSP